MNLGIQNKVALVAASSKGLGKACAMALAQEGAKVAITARGLEALQATAQEIRETTGAEVMAIPADVSQVDQVESLVSRILDAWGGIDILVNNAGGPPPGQFTDMSDEDWLAAVNLNLMSTIRMTRLALPGMRARGWGRIINLTSVSVKQPFANIILSNTARSGVVAMAKTLAGQVATEGVTVNNVCPGMFLTDRVHHIAQDNAASQGISEEQALDAMRATIPMRRIGEPRELAGLVAYIASEQAGFLTGATIQMDGGYYQGLL